jgi:HTH-type transcriptional regulator / antitoxin HigA
MEKAVMTVDIKPIRTKRDYRRALKEIDSLMDAEVNTPEGDRLELLSILVEVYEEKHFVIEDPDPIAAIEHRMEALCMNRKDLEEFIGPKSRVSEVLSRKRPLTLSMIRRIHQHMSIPAEILIRPYVDSVGRK